MKQQSRAYNAQPPAHLVNNVRPVVRRVLVVLHEEVLVVVAVQDDVLLRRAARGGGYQSERQQWRCFAATGHDTRVPSPLWPPPAWPFPTRRTRHRRRQRLACRPAPPSHSQVVVWITGTQTRRLRRTCHSSGVQAGKIEQGRREGNGEGSASMLASRVSVLSRRRYSVTFAHYD